LVNEDDYDDGHTQKLNLGAVFDQHIRHELEDQDVDETMQTMIKEPYVHHVPVMTGGVGFVGVYNFYKNHFIGKMPGDTKIVRISRTLGKDRLLMSLFSVSLMIERLISYYQAFQLAESVSSFLLWY
jgi:carboxymethylenebutenolidase